MLLRNQFDVLLQLDLNRLEPVQPGEGVVNAEDLEQEGRSKRESVIRDECFLVIRLLELVASDHNMVDLTRGHCWDQSEEIFQRQSCVIGIGETLIVHNHLAHVVVRVLALLLHQVHRRIKHLHCL